MANILDKNGITTGQTVEAYHVTQSIDAFTGTEAYDITLSGSFTVTGSTEQLGNNTVDGTVTANQFIGSLFGNASTSTSSSYATTASYAQNVPSSISSSYATSASYAQNSLSSSYALTSSYVENAQTASYVTLSQTASYVTLSQTASYYNETDPIFTSKSASFATTGSNVFTGDQTINGNITIYGTASIEVLHTIYNTSSIIYASGSTVFGDTMDDTHVFTGSLYVTGSVYATSSNAISSSYSVTSSYSNNSTSASYALTASYLEGYISPFPYTGSAQITGSLGVTGSTSIYGSGSTILSVSGSNGSLFTVNDSLSGSLWAINSGSNLLFDLQSDRTLTLSGSQSISGSLLVQNGITGSLNGTASWADNSITASYIVTSQTASYVTLAQTASYILNSVSSSYAATASYYAGSVVSASYASTSSIADKASRIDILVLNQTGNTIPLGTAVYISASNNSSDVPRIATASYESKPLSDYTLGILTSDVTTGNTGYVIVEGVLTGMDTSNYISGDILYLGPTGSLINSKPIAPLHSVRIGRVLREQSNNGSIFVQVNNGYELGEMHDVIDNTTTSSYGDLLIKSGSVWTNSRQLSGSYNLTGSLDIYKSGSTVLSVSGSNGTLFTVTDEVSGSLFTVWTGSTPIFNVDSGLITTITGSLSVQNGITGSLFGTSSWATNSLTASYYAGSIVSASYAATASYYGGSIPLSETASYVNPLTQDVTITGSIHLTGSYSQISSSIVVTLPSGSSRQDYGVPVSKYKTFSYLTTTRPIYEDNYIRLGYDSSGTDPEFTVNTNPSSGRVQVAVFSTKFNTLTISDIITASGIIDIYPNGIGSDERLDITVSAGSDPTYPFYRIIMFRSNTTYGGNVHVTVERFFINI